MRQSSDTGELAAAMRPVILRLGRRLRQMQDPGVELTASQSSVLGTLLQHDELTMGELAGAEKVRPPTVTRVVNGLQERGLVTRAAHPSDGRQSLVSLTAAGRELVLANRRVRNEWLAQRLEELSPRDRDLLEQALPILTRMNHA